MIQSILTQRRSAAWQHPLSHQVHSQVDVASISGNKTTSTSQHKHNESSTKHSHSHSHSVAAPLTHSHTHDARHPITYNKDGTEVTYSHVMHIPSTELCRPGSRYSVTTNFVAGAIALSTAFAVMHPLDTLKTKMQAAVNSNAASGAAQEQSLMAAIRQSVLSASTMRSLLSGAFASVAGAAPQGGMRFSTYELTKVELEQRGILTAQQPLLLSAISAACGDIVSSVVKVPREVLTQRLQTGQYKSGRMSDACSHIYRSEGVRGFYRGYASTQCRDVPFMILLFSCYENAKALTGELCDESSAFAALFGAASGATAGALTTPMDVIKTRIITSTVAQTQSQQSSLSIRSAYSQIVAQQGHRGLWTGCAPRSVWWFCVCGIFFPVYDWLHKSSHICVQFYERFALAAQSSAAIGV